MRIFPAISKGWTSSNSDTEWRFKIRDDVKFSDREKISPKSIVKSFTRILFKLKEKKSSNKLLLRIKDIQSLRAADSSIQGIGAEGDEVVFRLNAPTPDMLDILAFGLYAIVSPKNFNSNSGEWIPKKFTDYISSGPYKILAAAENRIELGLDRSYPADLHHPNAADRLNLYFGSFEMEDADIFIGSSDLKVSSGDFKFHSRNSTSIVYLICHSWNDPSGPLSNLSERKKIRNVLYGVLGKRGLGTVNSFFPQTLTGNSGHLVASFDNNSEITLHKEIEVKFDDIRPAQNSRANIIIDALEEALGEAGYAPVGVKNTPFEQVFQDLDPSKTSHSLDIGFYGTNIGINDPMGDIRHMFSPEGVWLPDADGRIRAELRKENFSVQKIDELIFQQAVIWPIVHFKYGIWVRSDLNLSDYNTTRPLGELQWIGST
jgi:hypothetical protein